MDKLFIALLAFVPLAIGAALAGVSPVVVFFLAAFAIVPLAKFISTSTEDLATRNKSRLSAGFSARASATRPNSSSASSLKGRARRSGQGFDRRLDHRQSAVSPGSCHVLGRMAAREANLQQDRHPGAEPRLCFLRRSRSSCLRSSFRARASRGRRRPELLVSLVLIVHVRRQPVFSRCTPINIFIREPPENSSRAGVRRGPSLLSLSRRSRSRG